MTPAANVIWRPHEGPQARFLELGVHEALYGGAAGGGKSEALIIGAIRRAHIPGYTGIIFRRTAPDLEKYLVERTRELYPRIFPGARYNSTKGFWRFPSGARVFLGHMEHDKDRFDHMGASYEFIGFDELTQFTRTQVTFLWASRARSSRGIPIRLRATTNPGGEGHDWVFDRYRPWLDPHCEVQAEPGQVLWYVTRPDGEEVWVPKGTEGSQSRVFVPARLEDNPTLMQNDPGYRVRMSGLDPVTRAQLADGNWLIREVSGTLFRPEWFREIPQAPLKLKRVRYWDRAATKVSKTSPNPDWTRGVLLGLDEETGYLYVEDVKGLRDSPGFVKKLIKETAEEDGEEVMVGLEQDPGQAGQFEIDEYLRLLGGYDVRAFPARKDKVTRARPWSAQVAGKKVFLVSGPWLKAYKDEHAAFPDPKHWHDDQVDASSGGYLALAGPAKTQAEDLLEASKNLSSVGPYMAHRPLYEEDR